jgi:hypothetical protein
VFKPAQPDEGRAKFQSEDPAAGRGVTQDNGSRKRKGTVGRAREGERATPVEIQPSFEPAKNISSYGTFFLNHACFPQCDNIPATVTQLA